MEKQSWALSTFEKILAKYPEVIERNRAKVPYTAEQGAFDDHTGDICWWTNGFYGGILWQLYYVSGQNSYRETAETLENKLDTVLMNYRGMDHDSGFRFLPTAVADYRIFGGERSKERGLLAAANLAGRFNPQGNFIRAWNDDDGARAGWAIIDCMMNLPLLYWASEITHDARFYNIAIRHADTVAENFIRENGSVRHIVEFNPETGAFVQDFGGQGYGQGSSWTRGQAWALYGFTLSYLYTGDAAYLSVAKRVADYFIGQIPQNGLIPVDFDQPAEVTWEDSTAAAIASSGLLLLSQILCGVEMLPGNHKNPNPHIEKETGERMEQAAVRMLQALDEHRCSWDSTQDELLEKCTAAYHDETHEFPIIYGDYYFIEAIFRLCKKELFIW